MQATFSIAEAKNKLPSIIHSVEDGPPVTLTRRGESVAVLLSIHDYERLKGEKADFWSALTKFRQTVEKEGVEISESDFKDLRDDSNGREIEQI